MTRSYYSNSILGFLKDKETEILGHLSFNHAHALEDLQKNAWIEQIRILKSALQSLKKGQIYFEFTIPRMGHRVDNILILDDLIFVIEFKVGDSECKKEALSQVARYCLDLKYFHEGSHNEKLIPVLVSTKANTIENIFKIVENLSEPLKANQNNISEIIQLALSHFSNGKQIDFTKWENSIYKPTPTIIEAAQALYRGHKVEEISRNDAGAYNLTETKGYINKVIETSKSKNKKSICFLTGVPGAGKTLAGLSIANERLNVDKEEQAVFLSGNGPLVDVLREALTRDKVKTAKDRGVKLTKETASLETHAFIQNIHVFRDDNFKLETAPVEKVVVFDESQRAWSQKQLTDFMKRKKGELDFNMSEPEFLISVMDKHKDWCTIVCLIGGGQEINTGEAGVSEWVSSLKNHYPNWSIYYSNIISDDKNYLSDLELIEWLRKTGTAEKKLHLDVNLRSFRSEKVSDLMHEILNSNADRARELFSLISPDYPIVLTRNLSTAKRWLKDKAKSGERIGIVASSGARRLKPLGIDVKSNISAPIWFLNNPDDVRSSNYLEDVATEFAIQGLEIDWACLAWDINLYFDSDLEKWIYKDFNPNGKRDKTWENVKIEQNQKYLLNTYRVLLTRARQGLVIFIPEGVIIDHTRPPKLYNQIFKFLSSCGIPEI